MASEPKPPLSSTSAPADLLQLKPEDLAALAKSATQIQGPVANAGNTLVIQCGNDAMVLFTRPRPLMSAEGMFANLAIQETVAIIHMSMATLKDFHWAIGENLRIYESTHSEIVTDAMKQRAAAKK